MESNSQPSDQTQALAIYSGPTDQRKPDEQPRELTQEQMMLREEQMARQEMKEAKKAFGLIYNTKKPEHAGSGILSGIGNIAKGTGAGIVAVGAMTVAGAKAQGVKGAAKGLGLGIVSGVGLTLAGVGTGVWQIGSGIANTPNAVKQNAAGKEWNAETGKFYTYNLQEEASAVLEKSEEQWLKEWKEENGAYQGLDGEAEARDGNCKDTELYDALGVAPDATSNQIKKAYYKLARETHPDKVGDKDPLAKEKFQKIGHAYQILIDDNLREKYDKEGEAGLKDAKTMDSKHIFEMIFGSDKFEPLIGELQLAMMATMEEQHPPELMEFKQKRREVQIAVNLATSLTLYAADKVGNTDDLQQECIDQAKELSANPMGKLLLGKIGWIYVEQAKQELGGLDAIGANIDEFKGGIKQKTAIASSLYKTYKAATKMQKEQKKHMLEAEKQQMEAAMEQSKRMAGEETKAKSEEKKSEKTAEEEADEYMKNADMNQMKGVADSMIDVTFNITLFDIESTLRKSIKKIFHDKGVPQSEKRLRAQGLLMMGKVFQKYGENDVGKGLRVMKEQISGQMEAAQNAARAEQERNQNNATNPLKGEKYRQNPGTGMISEEQFLIISAHAHFELQKMLEAAPDTSTKRRNDLKQGSINMNEYERLVMQEDAMHQEYQVAAYLQVFASCGIPQDIGLKSVRGFAPNLQFRSSFEEQAIQLRDTVPLKEGVTLLTKAKVMEVISMKTEIQLQSLEEILKSPPLPSIEQKVAKMKVSNALDADRLFEKSGVDYNLVEETICRLKLTEDAEFSEHVRQERQKREMAHKNAVAIRLAQQQ